MRTRRLPFYECRQGIFEIDEFDCGSIFVVVGTRALVWIRNWDRRPALGD